MPRSAAARSSRGAATRTTEDPRETTTWDEGIGEGARRATAGGRRRNARSGRPPSAPPRGRKPRRRNRTTAGRPGGSRGCRSLRPRARPVRPARAAGSGRRHAQGTVRARTRLPLERRPSRCSRDQVEQACADPFRFPFASSLPSTLACRNIACASSSSTVTTTWADRDRDALGGPDGVAGGVLRHPVAHERVAEDALRHSVRLDVLRLDRQHRRDLRLVVQPRGAYRPRDVLLGARDAALEGLVSRSVLRAGGQEQGSGEERRQDARLLHDVVLHVTAGEGGAGGVQHRPPAALHERLEGGGKAGCPTASGRSTTLPSRIAPRRRCPLRS